VYAGNPAGLRPCGVAKRVGHVAPKNQWVRKSKIGKGLLLTKKKKGNRNTFGTKKKVGPLPRGGNNES